MNKEKARILSQKLQEHLVAFAKEHGVVAKVGSGRFDDSQLTLKVEFAEPSGDGTVLNKDMNNFAAYAAMFGLKPEYLNREFTDAGRRMKVTGLKPQSPKFPVLCVDLATNKTYKYPADRVANALRE